MFSAWPFRVHSMMRRCPAALRGWADFKDRSKGGFTANDTILHETKQRRRRPYKPPFRHEAALLILTKGDYGTRPEHFDPKLLDLFASCEGGFREIFDSDQKT
jgi:hypothetical protein